MLCQPKPVNVRWCYAPRLGECTRTRHGPNMVEVRIWKPVYLETLKSSQYRVRVIQSQAAILWVSPLALSSSVSCL